MPQSVVTAPERTLGEHGGGGPSTDTHFFFVDPTPKRVWCLVKNEGEAVFNKCQLTLRAPTAPCVQGEYFVINLKNAGPPTPTYWWIAFGNQHTNKTRVVYVAWEP